MFRAALRCNSRTLSAAAAVSAASVGASSACTSAEKATPNAAAVRQEGSDAKRQQGFFTSEEVSKRDGRACPEMWVSYDGSVYDVTSYAAEHPGGESLLRDAAGGPIEQFWGYWAFHKDSAKAPSWLRRYRIGTLVVDDDAEDEDEDEDEGDVENEFYESDPLRGSMQIPLSQRPWCSDTDPRAMRSHFTANDAFYVRNHAPVPRIESENHEIVFENDLGEEDDDNDSKASIVSTSAATSMDLTTLRDRFDSVTVHSTLQCAGNRGSEMMAIAPTAFAGTPYETIRCGMMGNAAWTGPRLREVLLGAFPQIRNFSDADVDSYHVEFEGADGYRTSSPLRNVLEEESDALLAFEMNGEPLPPDHGRPVRAFLPGHAGARSVKWLSHVRLRREESDSSWSQYYYKDPEGKSIQRMPLQSFLLSKRLSGECVLAKGVAWGGGKGKGVSKVEVSTDEGRSWVEARIINPRDKGEKVGKDAANGKWSWVHFEANVPLREQSPSGSLPVVFCRAHDGDGKCQPEKVWYPKGYLYNGWHQI